MKFIFLCICLFFLNGPLLASDDDDFGIWTFIGLSVKTPKVVTFYTEAEYRTRENTGKVDCWSLYGEISAKINPYLKAGVGYTYIDYNHPSLSWESRHRLNAFVSGNFKAGPWSFAVRERYEQVHRILSDQSGPNPTPKRTLRSRIECNYKIARSHFTPYATLELYTGLNTGRGVANDKLRYTVGTLISICRHHSFSIYYRYIDMMQQTSGNSHILGMGFRFSL